MRRETKTTQLQLRVSVAQKRLIQRSAKSAGMSVSAWILARVQPECRQEMQHLFDDLSRAVDPSYLLAELNDRLGRMDRAELERVLGEPMRPPARASLQNQIAAMIELAAHRRSAAVPAWVRDIPPLTKPVFATGLMGLRLHLLVHAPPPFRRRNLFVDSSLGDQV